LWRQVVIFFVDSFGFVQLDESLSFAPPKESNQRKGGHSSLAFGFPRVDVIYRVGLIRHPCLKQPLLEHPVLVTRKSHRHSAVQKGEVPPPRVGGFQRSGEALDVQDALMP